MKPAPDCRAYFRLLAAHGFEVISFANVQGVTNIYDETPERAYTLACMVDREDAEAVFRSGTLLHGSAGLRVLGAE
jgi:maleate cis-trans isomerase